MKENITNERIIMNMINSFLGRMHLASHLELLTEEQFTLVKEGVEYYNSLTEAKKTALPYFPNGFTSFGEKVVAAGFKTAEKLYLAVWNLGEEERTLDIETKEKFASACVGYPKADKSEISLKDGKISIKMQAKNARMIELKRISN